MGKTLAAAESSLGLEGITCTLKAQNMLPQLSHTEVSHLQDV